MGTKHLDQQQSDTILATYQACPCVVQTASTTGVTVRQVRHLLKRRGVSLSRARGGACYRHIDSVRAWASGGVAVSEIARRIGTTSSKVSAFLKKHDIPRTPFQQTGANNPAWRGGRVIDKNGYVLVKASSHPAANRHGYVREHRLVMETKLDRYLTATEVVHHKDDDKQNNHPGNLELFETNADHLAETLKGRKPKHTEAGLDRLRESGRRTQARRRTATRPA